METLYQENCSCTSRFDLEGVKIEGATIGRTLGSPGNQHFNVQLKGQSKMIISQKDT